MKSYYKNEKGSMTIYAIVTVFTFIFILGSIFYSAVGIRTMQLKTMPKIKEAYEKYLNSKYTIYEAEVEKRRDKVAPTIDISLSTTTAKVGEAITVTINIKDNKDRLDYSKCSYTCNKAGEGVYKSGSLSTGVNTITISFSSTGSYTITVSASDLDQNTNQVSSNITINN